MSCCGDQLLERLFRSSRFYSHRFRIDINIDFRFWFRSQNCFLQMRCSFRTVESGNAEFKCHW